jgi:hypothetical protein
LLLLLLLLLLLQGLTLAESWAGESVSKESETSL